MHDCGLIDFDRKWDVRGNGRFGDLQNSNGSCCDDLANRNERYTPKRNGEPGQPCFSPKIEPAMEKIDDQHGRSDGKEGGKTDGKTHGKTGKSLEVEGKTKYILVKFTFTPETPFYDI